MMAPAGNKVCDWAVARHLQFMALQCHLQFVNAPDLQMVLPALCLLSWWGQEEGGRGEVLSGCRPLSA